LNRHPLGLVLLSLTLLGAKPNRARDLAKDWAPPTSGSDYFVRSTFDADPSALLGRFLPDEGAPDDGAGFASACSVYVRAKEVLAGGSYDVTMTAGSAAAASFGLPPLIGLDAHGSRTQTVRIKYHLTKKLQYDVSDPVAWRRCCNQAPDQCSGRFISEFVAGEGTLYFAVGREGAVLASKAPEGLIEAHGGYLWQQATTLDGMYFAFKTAVMELDGPLPTGACTAPEVTWDDLPPLSPDGQYIIGVSVRTDSEQEARTLAREDAHRQAVEMCDGVDIQFAAEGTIERSTEGGAATSTGRSSESGTTLGGGQVRLLEARATCTEHQDTPMGRAAWLVKTAYVLPGGCPPR
jgi:hypothetical protein